MEKERGSERDREGKDRANGERESEGRERGGERKKGRESEEERASLCLRVREEDE